MLTWLDEWSRGGVSGVGGASDGRGCGVLGGLLDREGVYPNSKVKEGGLGWGEWSGG